MELVCSIEGLWPDQKQMMTGPTEWMTANLTEWMVGRLIFEN
jgi:hypothetical protein